MCISYPWHNASYNLEHDHLKKTFIQEDSLGQVKKNHVSRPRPFHFLAPPLFSFAPAGFWPRERRSHIYGLELICAGCTESLKLSQTISQVSSPLQKITKCWRIFFQFLLVPHFQNLVSFPPSLPAYSSGLSYSYHPLFYLPSPHLLPHTRTWQIWCA